MRIGYVVQGSTDRAVVTGLRNRWCPDAELVEGHFRGTNPRRELPKACIELWAKGCDAIVSLTDADEDDWRTALGLERRAVPPEYWDRVVLGVADRNIECWLALDREYLAGQIGCPASDLDTEDPKGVFESQLHITRDDKKEDEIARIVLAAPLGTWLRDPSFAAFHDDARSAAARMECRMPNERGDT